MVRSAPSARRCDTRVGITLASVVISAARRSPSAAFRSAKLSTSPLRAAVTYGPGEPSSSRLSTGCALGCEMIPMLAQRVWPRTSGGGALAGQRQAQQVVGEQVGAHGRGVVTELADLGRRLVDEAEVALRGADRVRAEQVVVAARRDQARHRGIVEIEAVVADEHGEPGRVPSAHLEAVERGQRLLDRRADLDGRPRRLGRRPALARPSPSGRRSRATAHSASLSRRREALAVLERVALGRTVGVEAALHRSDPVPGRRGDGCGARRHLAVRGRGGRRRRGSAAGRRAPRAASAARLGRGDRVDAVERALDRGEAVEHVGGREVESGARPAQEGDDAAHGGGGLPVRGPEQRTGGISRPRGPPPRSHQAVGRGLGLLVGGGLDHHPHERLGAAPSDQHSAVVAELGLHRRDVVGQRRGDVHALRGDAHVVEHLGQAGHRRVGQVGERPLRPAHDVEELDRGQQPVARGGQVGEHDVPALLAAEGQTPVGQGLQHVAVADGHLEHLDRRARPSPAGTRGWSSR